MNDVVLGTYGRLVGEEAPVGVDPEKVRLEKINAALIKRIENDMDRQGNAYALFQAAISLENQVRERTEELSDALHALEENNKEMLVAKEGAEIANRSKTKFLTAAGHDLLQPLNAARLCLSALSETRLTPQGGELVGQVDRALETIEELIKSLLDISRLDAGVMKPDISDVSIRDLMFAVHSDFEPLAREKGLRMRLVATDAVVACDPLLLKRLIGNLASNAVRYTLRGGILLGARRRGDGLRIDVIDTGVGIPEDQHEVVFEEFQRGPVQGDLSSAGPGLGLGLSIVRRLADTLGYQLSLDSVVGRGTRFSLDLPIARSAARDVAKARPQALRNYGLNNARVLFIENDHHIARAMTALLERWQCDCRTAIGPDDCMALLSEEGYRPDIVIADYHLDDDECGLDVVGAVKAILDHDIPAIIVTADHNDEVADRVKKKGLELLRKPVKPAELRALMAHLLA